ncbi:hypothetical protein [Ralstonia insidiosa]|uniref:hypothetical protein n=1 Tax=Ralstonia insidiosa TaxID=190721 RepID=UPI000CEE71BD|nr:hypothetical protein [Ralstonia insidiosa]
MIERIPSSGLEDVFLTLTPTDWLNDRGTALRIRLDEVRRAATGPLAATELRRIGAHHAQCARDEAERLGRDLADAVTDLRRGTPSKLGIKVDHWVCANRILPALAAFACANLAGARALHQRYLQAVQDARDAMMRPRFDDRSYRFAVAAVVDLARDVERMLSISVGGKQ